MLLFSSTWFACVFAYVICKVVGECGQSGT